MKATYIYAYITLALCIFSNTAKGQDPKQLVRIKGDFGLYGDFYSMNTDVINAVSPRRPDFLGRVVVNTSFELKDFSMPVTLALPTQQFGVTVPPVPSIPDNPTENFRTLLRNPLNKAGIAPKYKWAQVLLGSQTPAYSELSVGDLSMNGAGFNLSPGVFRFSAFAGTSQLAIEADTAQNIAGIYARKIYSAKIGFGDEDSSHIYLIGSKMQDDTTSLKSRPISLVPQAGFLSSVVFRLNLGKSLFIKGEVAGSLFTRNLESDEVPEFVPSVPAELLVPKISTRMDFASVASIGGNWKNFGINITGRYYGDGFVPLGFPFMQVDRLEATVDPRFILFKNKLQLTGSIGRRINNLSGIRGTTASQTIGAANVNWDITNNLSISGTYSNFGFRNTALNDTFRIEMVTESWSINPVFRSTSESAIHIFMLNYGQDAFTDFNSISGAINTNDAQNAMLSYTYSLLEKPLSLSIMANYLDNQISLGRLNTKSVTAGLSYKFFENKLTSKLGFTAADNTFNNSSNGFQFMSNLGVKYAIKKKIFLNIRGSINVFEFGENRPGISYREDFLRTSLTYKL
jgi:hypothetical protein